MHIGECVVNRTNMAINLHISELDNRRVICVVNRTATVIHLHISEHVNRRGHMCRK